MSSKKLAHLQILIDQNGLGYRTLGSVDSICVEENTDGSFRFWDDSADTRMDYDDAVRVLSMCGSSDSPWYTFWNESPSGSFCTNCSDDNCDGYCCD